ncbi:MAG: hypothetical protein ABIJ26_03340 [Candidatus Margulisiibacteriota bacterium]
MAIQVGNISNKVAGNQDAMGFVKDLAGDPSKANPLKSTDSSARIGTPGLSQDQEKFAEFVHQTLGNKMTQVNIVV